MSCSCGATGYWGNGCCPTCSPSNVAIRGQCTDPGTITSARSLVGLDSQFCHGRITNGPGLLNNVINGSGNSQITWSNTPKIDPESVTAAETTAFGNFLILSADSRMRQLQAPNIASLVVQTNGSGQFVLDTIPAATVPDPLNVNDLGVADQATIDKLEVNDTFEINNLSAGTAVNLLALNASNQVILQALAQGLSISMFFESATSPSPANPNIAKTSGQYFEIGNKMFGGTNVGIQTGQSLIIQEAGNYLIFWSAQHRCGSTAGKVGTWLEINGTVVNYGNGKADAAVSNGAVPQMYGAFGMDVRTYALNDVIKLLLYSSYGALQTLEVRLIAVRIP